jgi:hypothetical protein
LKKKFGILVKIRRKKSGADPNKKIDIRVQINWKTFNIKGGATSSAVKSFQKIKNGTP